MLGMNVTRLNLTFDMSYAVGDIEWLPYSSTDFAAVISNGMLFFWDLWQDKYSHLIAHRAFKNQEALHLTFSYKDSIVLVGDDNGGVNYFKLSDSLRKGPTVHKPTKGE